MRVGGSGPSCRSRRKDATGVLRRRARWAGGLTAVAISLTMILLAIAPAASAGHVGAKAAPRSGLQTEPWATSRGNDTRDGWYPNQPGLAPSAIASSGFGQVFETQLNGQIYAQPLLVKNVLIVATETDWVYGVDPQTGAVEWSRRIGRFWPDASLHCGDLVPDMGITSTPTVDPSTDVVYMVDQSYLSGDSGPIGWFMHAINPVSGQEMPHFPVEIKGPVSNNPKQYFLPDRELQRTGLLFLGGVVYAAFGSHCDYPPYSGIIAGVSTKGHETTLWSTESTLKGGGGGIWQAGGGLVSDGPRQILFASANGDGGTVSHPNGPVRSASPPPNLSDSVVRLVVQSNGSLKATNFFSPYNDTLVDARNWDLSGAPVALPSQFSAPKYPDLLVVTGKQGIVYLLNRENLGGVGEGPGGKDAALWEKQMGEAIATAGVWPGNGGYVYVSTDQSATGGAGQVDVYKFGVTSKGVPKLNLVGTGSQTAVFGVSGALVTSQGTTSGTAVVWVVDGANLLAYAPVPVAGKLPLIRSFFVGNSTPFNPPGMGNGMLYVGNLNGDLYGFGQIPTPTTTTTTTTSTTTSTTTTTTTAP